MIHFRVFADYFQIYLEDVNPPARPEPSAWDAALAQSVGIVHTPAHLGIATRTNVTIDVDVELAERPPPLDCETWEYVADASLDVPSGRIRICGPTDYGGNEDDCTLELPRGCYGVRICRRTEPTSDEVYERREYLHLTLWPSAEQAEPRLVHGKLLAVPS